MSTIDYKTVIYPDGDFIQVSATGINPVGVLPAVADDIGLGSALKFVDASTRVAGANFAIPPHAVVPNGFEVRLGWAADTNTGNVRWSITYLWLASDDDITAAGAEVIIDSPVSTTANGYTYTAFTLAAPAVGDRVLMTRITRYGGHANDTCAGDVYLLGALLAFDAE